MGSAAATVDEAGGTGGGPGKSGKKKLVFIAVPFLFIAIGAGLWFTGVLPSVLGMKKATTEQQKDEREREAAHSTPVFVDLPEMVANLNAPGRRPSYVKLKARIELAKTEDQAAFTAAQPRVIDLFQTYLREMRPDELRGSAGTYRLRAELMVRANIAIAPAKITDVLFSELLVQ